MSLNNIFLVQIDFNFFTLLLGMIARLVEPSHILILLIEGTRIGITLVSKLVLVSIKNGRCKKDFIVSLL